MANISAHLKFLPILTSLLISVFYLILINSHSSSCVANRGGSSVDASLGRDLGSVASRNTCRRLHGTLGWFFDDGGGQT